MKKLILALLFVLVLTSQSWAAWTVTSSKVSAEGHYIYWQVLCTSDSSSLTATNILKTASGTEAVVTMPLDLLEKIQGSTLMVMDVIPGTGAVIPDTTINITLTNSLGITLYADTGISKDATTAGANMSADYSQYPVIGKELNIAVNDIGGSGDQVTFVFLCWIED